MKNCVFCNKLFTPTNLHRKHCSFECRKKLEKVKTKEWLKRNPQRRHFYLKRWRDNNLEKCRQWSRNYYQKTREQQRKKHKIWYSKNKERVAIKFRKYHLSPSWIYRTVEKGNRRFAEVPILTKERFIEWYNSQKRVCFYCGVEELKMKELNMVFNKTITRLTIDRTDNSKGYIIGNMVLACHRCNSIKGNFFTKEEMLKIAEIFIKPKLL